METNFLSSSLLSPLPFSTGVSQRQKIGFCCSKRSNGKVFAGGEPYDWDRRGQLVDESMVVLRKRIHELKVIDRNYEPPAEWMDLEKQYYTSYHVFICKFVGMLQLQLMNTRPSLALGMLLFIMMSVPASTVMIVSHSIAAVNDVLAAVHFM